MRVIAGSARRLLLKTPEGMETRPTQDRIKETLFNILQDVVPGRSFLDLYAGSGGIGIEALSRDAVKAVFVDSSKKSRDCIVENLKHCHLEDRATVLCQDVFSAIPFLEREGTFDIIFMDPPYGKELDRDTLAALSKSRIVNEDTLIIVEEDLHRSFDFLDETGFYLEREKLYKTNKHAFIRKKAGEI